MQTLGALGSFLRSVALGLAVLVLLCVALAANLGIWSARTVLSEDVFVATADRALDDPAVRAYIAGVLADRLFTALAEGTGQVPDALMADLGLDPAATRDQVTSTLSGLVDAALTEPLLAPARQAALREIHDAILSAGTGDRGLSIQGDALLLDLDVVLQRTLTKLDPSLPAAAISTGTGSIVVLRAEGLTAVSSVLRALDIAVWLLSLLVAGAALMVLVLATHRLHALAWIGACLAVAGAVGAAFGLLGATLLTAGLSAGPGRDAAHGLWSGLLDPLLIQSIIVTVAGLAIGIIGVTLGSRFGTRRQLRFG